MESVWGGACPEVNLGGAGTESGCFLFFSFSFVVYFLIPILGLISWM